MPQEIHEIFSRKEAIKQNHHSAIYSITKRMFKER